MSQTLGPIADRFRPVQRDTSAVTRPTARVLALLEILQSGGTRTVGELADRLGVDERTVRRYVVHLTDLDVPVRSVRGRYGGYRLAPGHRMPPLLLTDEEALAVLLGLVASRRAGLVATSVAAAESAAAKLRRSIPDVLRRRLDALLLTTEFTSRPEPVATPETGVLLLLAEAARDRRAVALGYTASDGRRTERTVEPYGIVAHSGRWYITGADSASGQLRTFRVDRVSSPRALLGTFDVPARFDPAEQVLSGLARKRHRYEVSVRVQGPPGHVLSRLPAGIAVVDQIADEPGWVRVQIRAERLDWVPGLLAGLGLPFVVEGPEPLRDLVRALAEQLAAAVPPDPGQTDS
jgi:predicted DNA-binding transcriptional regulator YafY